MCNKYQQTSPHCRVKTISRVLAAALALYCGSAVAGSLFPSVPYYMQSQKINRTKPNLVLLLDNSGSMTTQDAQDLYTGAKTQRYIAARQVALKVFDKYKNTFRWGLAFLNEQTENDSRLGAAGTTFSNDYVKNGSDYSIGRSKNIHDYGFKGAGNGHYFYRYEPRSDPFTSQPSASYELTDGFIDVPINDNGDGNISSNQEYQIKKYINSMYGDGGTPITRALRSVYNYMSASDYSFVANSKDANEYWHYYSAPNNPNYAMPQNAGYDPRDDPKLVMQYRCQKNYVVLISDGENGDSSTNCSFKYQDTDNTTDSGRSKVCPWKMAYSKDYRTDNFSAMPADLDGKSWDDKYFPQQNIITHTIGFNTNANSLKIIADQSGGKFVSATNTKALESALSSILKSASLEAPEYIRYDRINFTNPLAVLSGNSANSLIPSVTIDPDYWSSNIQFKRLDKNSASGYQQNINSQDIVAYPITDNADKRTVLATIPTANGNGELVDISRSNINKISLNNDSFNLQNLFIKDAGDAALDIFKVDSDGNIVYDDPPFNTKPQFNNNAKKLNNDKWKKGYIPWLTGWEGNDYVDNKSVSTPWNPNPSYRDRTGQSTATNAADANMRRHLGDVTRVDLAMMGPGITRDVGPFQATFTLPKFMVVQSNDGMVRIYSAVKLNSDRPYWERFAYIPGNANRNGNADDKTNAPSKFLHDLTVRARQYYKQGYLDHEYFMSGAVNYYSTPDLKNAKQRQRYFFIGLLGQGGKAAYALNVGGRDDVSGNFTGIDANATVTTTENKYNANDKINVPLWDTSTTAFGAAGEGIHGLGYTISNAVVGQVALTRKEGKVTSNSPWQYVTFLPNGYDYSTSDNKPVIYMLDTLGFQYEYDSLKKETKAVATNKGKAGKVIDTITITQAKPGAVLSGVSAVDYDGDNMTDALYVGDSNGNLYRVDLRITDASGKHPVTTLFKGDAAHPITAAPSLARVNNKRYVIFGTGRNYLEEDTIRDNTPVSSIAIQSIYGIRDKAVDSITSAQPEITYIDRNQYLWQRKLAATSNNLARTVIDIKNNKPTVADYGWYVDLSIDDNNGNPTKTGERVTVKPIVETTGRDATVFFNTETVSFKSPANSNNWKCVGASADTTGWVYQLNAANGLIPTKVYSDIFVLKNVTYAGVASGGDNLTYYDPDNRSQNLNGEANSNGDLPDGIGSFSGGCKGKGNEPILAASPTNISKLHKICDSTTIRRVSWREIPLGYRNIK